MYWHGCALASTFLLIQLEAFTVPTLSTKVLVDNASLLFAQNEKSATSFNEKSITQLDRQSYDAPTKTNQLRNQVETFLAPATSFLDDASDGWALSYADLTPDR